MFDKVINSKKLSQAAATFLTLPLRSYSISEAARILRASSGTAAHSLNELQAEGLLKSCIKHGKKYFFVNPKAVLPAWVRNKILRFKKKQADPLAQDLKKLGLKGAFLSGVFAGLSHLPVDLLLVGRPDLTKLNKFLHKWQEIMGLELNYSIMSQKEFISRRDTFDKFIKDIFDHRHVVVLDRVEKK